MLMSTTQEDKLIALNKEKEIPTYQDLVEALKYSHRFASRDAGYDFKYTEHILSQIKFQK